MLSLLYRIKLFSHATSKCLPLHYPSCLTWSESDLHVSPNCVLPLSVHSIQMFIVTLFLLPLPISMQRLVSTLPQPLTPITNVSFLHGTVNLAISIVCYHHIYFNVSVLFCPNCLFKLCSLSYSQRVFNLLFLFLSLLLFVFTLLISISLSIH